MHRYVNSCMDRYMPVCMYDYIQGSPGDLK